MKIVDRFQIRKDLDAITEALHERFLKADDPSVSILNFLEQVANATGAVKHLYAKGADDRNTIVDSVREQVKEIKSACDALEQALANDASSPEDNDDELPSDAES